MSGVGPLSGAVSWVLHSRPGVAIDVQPATGRLAGMSLMYRLMYRVGFTPWDTGEVPTALNALIEGPGALPTGRALDIGCGTGTQAVYMAGKGWEVTAVDAVPRPLSQARARAAAAGVSVDWILADATRLHRFGLAPGFTLIFDRGCFHGLDDSQRGAYGAAVDGLAAPGATLLMMAFAPNRVLAAPAGLDQSELVGRFVGWQLTSASPDTEGEISGPLRNVPRSWYRLVRG
jgi:SAM-dependent methyltransferase